MGKFTKSAGDKNNYLPHCNNFKHSLGVHSQHHGSVLLFSKEPHVQCTFSCLEALPVHTLQWLSIAGIRKESMHCTCGFFEKETWCWEQSFRLCCVLDSRSFCQNGEILLKSPAINWNFEKSKLSITLIPTVNQQLAVAILHLQAFLVVQVLLVHCKVVVSELFPILF